MFYVWKKSWLCLGENELSLWRSLSLEIKFVMFKEEGGHVWTKIWLCLERELVMFKE